MTAAKIILYKSFEIKKSKTKIRIFTTVL